MLLAREGSFGDGDGNRAVGSLVQLGGKAREFLAGGDRDDDRAIGGPLERRKIDGTLRQGRNGQQEK